MWWVLWLAFVIVLLFLPLGYGWGYRGWGAPYPSYYRGRRPTRGEALEEQAAYAEAESRAADAETSGWGIVADLVWIVAVVAIVWFILALIF